MSKPDLDLLALAGHTKASLKQLNSESMGGNAHADRINLKELAMGHKTPNQPNRSQKGPDLLKSFDFITPPKSKPLGQVTMDGIEIPPERQLNPTNFVEIPSDLLTSVLHQADNDENPIIENHPQLNTQSDISNLNENFDFDLFQFTAIKDIIKELDANINTLNKSVKSLTIKRDKLKGLISNNENEPK
jgi:hypothetical protein